jgi:hypothetical protein
MTFLGGTASVNGTIDTTKPVNSFDLKGGVSNMRIGAVLRALQVNYPVSDALQVRYDLSGAGKAIAPWTAVRPFRCATAGSARAFLTSPGFPCRNGCSPGRREEIRRTSFVWSRLLPSTKEGRRRAAL